jgi:hypothetical protein
MKAVLSRLGGDLGPLGITSLLLMAAAVAFSLGVLRPLDARSAKLDQELASAALRVQGQGLRRVSAGTSPARLDAFYRFFERPERTDEWLAKVYGIATASGLELRSGDYRLAESRERIERYQITLPVTGSYAQIRSFLEGALAEIPVLSLDHVSFRRKSANEARIEAEVVLTLHLLKK